LFFNFNNGNTSSTLKKAGSVLSFLTAIGTTVAKIHPATALVANALSVGLSMYALATDDSPETEQAVNDLLTAANNLVLSESIRALNACGSSVCSFK
jgi:hypothetical protein